MTLPGLVAANNLSDVVDRERAWDNLGLNVSVNVTTPESLAYIAAVEAADGAFLEEEVKQAIHGFVAGCNLDGIWPAIKASCILAGARTLAGALVPLVGAAPTNVGGLFDSGDYNRKTGLVGDGSTKYLNSNRANNVDPINNQHISVWQSTPGTRDLTRSPIGADGIQSGGSHLIASATDRLFRIQFAASALGVAETTNVPGLWGATRSNSSTVDGRYANTNYTLSIASIAPIGSNIAVYGRSLTSTNQNLTNARLAFYSIGESLNLALLDARVTTLINAFAAAIP